MYQQASLFPDESGTDNKCYFENIRSTGMVLQTVDIGDITFKAGLSEPIHRWYRLTPSFSPNLVRYFLKEFNTTKEDTIFDPFSGRGTTVIECQKHGIKAIGCEINPTLQKSGELSLKWNTNKQKLFSEFIKDLSSELDKFKNKTIEHVTEHFNTRIPIIHNVLRWWKPEVLKDMIIARELTNNETYKDIHEYLWLSINKAAIDCANIHRNHPTITFDDNHSRIINVYDEIRKNLKNIKEDLETLTPKELSYSCLNNIYLGNSTNKLTQIVKDKITVVITSPPYPNRFSYVHQTRPQLHFMELLNDITEATTIDMNAIGGTWGRATSILQKELILIPDDLVDVLDYYEDLKNKSTLMCNYATKYFLDLRTHIQQLKEIISEDFKGAYVVGNSRLSGVEIFTETILAKICQLEGFKVDKIISFRKRGGRKKLYESAVCIRI